MAFTYEVEVLYGQLLPKTASLQDIVGSYDENHATVLARLKEQGEGSYELLYNASKCTQRTLQDSEEHVYTFKIKSTHYSIPSV